MKPHKLIPRTFVILALTSALMACAGPGPKPTSELQLARASIQQAEANDARQFDPVLLNQAQNKLADARELIDKPDPDEEDYTEARRLLEQAAVDAQLAGARAETEKAQRAVAEISRSIEDLQNQLEMDQQ
ncbi:DUF4398 domain-containing protein [Marinobacter sp. M216]|uniref:DUF4398 domain-containing protein n=1 Tax=Marinobacter albus TaxID=3030833 RepID=A0ABT7HCX7_9GAMM|nr:MULTISPECIES: DUF4398 domain-containing protein [unclassified Marinobacter]MBW7469513.1 DUF4398 domain-containing protein [Marinobacter sp. F4218]MDK9558218.1 DUF4398 domain-containing protein [Marinobacter sp. M216]